MSASYQRVLYALQNGDFREISEQPLGDERDNLLTLLAIYVLPVDKQPHLLLQRLEEWLQHTLDQRVVHLVNDDIAGYAAVTHADFYDWLNNYADAQQVEAFLATDQCAEPSEHLPIAVLYRLALDAMLDNNLDALRPEREGSRAIAALLPLPSRNARIVRGARWRDDVEARYLRDLHTLLATRELQGT